MSVGRMSGGCASLTLQGAHPWKSRERLRQYQIVKKLGLSNTTSTSVHCQAWDTVRHQHVVIRTLSPYLEDDPVARQAFSRDSESWATLIHPNIVKPLDHFEDKDGMPYRVEQCLQGSSLRHQLRRSERPFTLHEAITYGAQLADALAYSHRLGIVHSDIKPSNVFIEDNGTAYLIDYFGLTRVAGSILGAICPGATLNTWRPSRCWARRPTLSRMCIRWESFYIE